MTTDRFRLRLEIGHLVLGARKIDGGREQEVGVARGEVAALAGTGGIDDRGADIVPWPGTAIASLEFEELAVPVERFGERPDLLHHVEPFLRIAVTRRMVRGQGQAERLVFRLVPSGDDIEPGATVADFVD